MFWKYFNYALKKDKTIIAIAALVLLIASALFIGLFIGNYKIDQWSNIIDPIVTLITVSTALLVYFSNSKKDWENSLEKRLTVHFEWNGKFLMTCHEAYLSNESDIRAWGQTIGSQMTKNTSLKFYPFISENKKSNNIFYDEKINQEYKLYEVTFHLINIDEQTKEDKQPDLKSKYLVWWENNDKSHGNKEVWFNEQPTLPKSIDEAIAELERQATQNS